MLVGQLLHETARRWPENEGLVDGDVRLTYRQWDSLVNGVARNMAERLQVKPGDRIGVFAHNSMELVTAALAIQKLGAVHVSINFRLSRDELQYQVEDSGLVVLFYDAELADVAEPCLAPERLGVVIGSGAGGSEYTIAYQDLVDESDDVPDVRLGPDDLSVIMYTSGTTGRPKGVMLSQRAQWVNTVLCALDLGIRPEDRTLHMAPLFHVAAFHVMLLPHIMMGATNVILRRFDPAAVFSQIRAHGITTLLGVPTQYDRIAKATDLVHEPPETVRFAVNTGAPIRQDTADAIRRVLTPNLGAVYGLTEVASLLTFLPPEQGARRGAGCIGRALVGVETRVIEPDHPEEEHREVKRGNRGVLIGRTPKLMDGYLHHAEKTRQMLVDGWIVTGDIVIEDDDGYFTLVDRLDDMIVSGGENIYPQEVERVLLQHPGVNDCTVLGVPDEEWGQLVKAFIVANDPDLEGTAMDAFCLDGRLARYKRPRIYEFVTEIPRNPSGKILRKLLRTDDQRASSAQ